MKPECKPLARGFFHPRFSRVLGAREVSTAQQDELEIVRATPRIRPHRQLVSDSRFFEASDVQANRRHPIVRSIEVRSGGQNVFKGRNCFGVLKILRRTP
jgi:hypothetical protein